MQIQVHIGTKPPPFWKTYVHFPEVEHGFPLMPAQVAEKADTLLKYGFWRVVTTSEMFVLRLRRRIAEGADIQMTISFDGIEKEVTVDKFGEVDWWLDGLFSEDFAEVKAIRRAQIARGDL